MLFRRWYLQLILSCLMLWVCDRECLATPGDPAAPAPPAPRAPSAKPTSSAPSAKPTSSAPSPSSASSGFFTPSCDDDAECALLAIKAHESSQSGHADEAQRTYEAAYAIRKDPKLLYNRARVLHKAGRFIEAEAVYQKYLDVGAEGSAELRKKVQEYMVEVRQQMAEEAAQQAALAKAKVVPIYRKWWLWTLVGVATAGLAIGIAVGVASRRPDFSDAAEARPFP